MIAFHLTRFLTQVVHLANVRTTQRRFAPMLPHITGITGPLHRNTHFLVRVEKATYRAYKDKPFLTLILAIEEPTQFSACRFSARIYCTPKALWKLSWFLRDFGYDTDLLGRDEIDDKVMTGLHGVVKISHNNLNGRSSNQ